MSGRMVDQQQETTLEENIKTMLMIKGKRSKRSRLSSPSILTMSTTSATNEAGSVVSEEWAAPNCTASEEEEDTARCLILLAQGSCKVTELQHNNVKISSAPKNNVKAMSYECKTCNKSFPSFQALGGHRTSHKKPKLNVAVPEPKKSSPLIFSLIRNDHDQIQERIDQFNDDGISLTLQMANSPMRRSNNNPNTGVITKVSKVHECGICGAEFSSGQALGGHMRRHRPLKVAAPLEETTVATTSNIMSLDLNLPAPEEDCFQVSRSHDNSSKFVFASNEKTLVFTASSLVDCQY